MISKKGEIYMYIDLSTYLEELKNEKLEIETSSDEEEIKRVVAEYEAKVREEYATARATKLNEKTIEIDVLERILAREAEKVANQSATTEVIDNLAPVEPEVAAVNADVTPDFVAENVESQSINNDFADL